MNKQVDYIEATYEVSFSWTKIQSQVKTKYDIDLTIDMIDTIYAKYTDMEITLHDGEVLDLGMGDAIEADYKWPVGFFISTTDNDELYRGKGMVAIDLKESEEE